MGKILSTHDKKSLGKASLVFIVIFIATMMCYCAWTSFYSRFTPWGKATSTARAATLTETYRPSSTQTLTQTLTLTITPTLTQTTTKTQTPTVTLSPTTTKTPTLTLSPTITTTPTTTLSPTISLTPTITHTLTSTITTTLSPTPTKTKVPTKTKTLTPTISPTFDPNTINGFIYYGSSVSVFSGDDAWAKIITRPGKTCSIEYYTPAGTHSQASGLYEMKADKDGYCSWYWKIGSSTKPGQGKIIITANGQTSTYYIEIK